MLDFSSVFKSDMVIKFFREILLRKDLKEDDSIPGILSETAYFANQYYLFTVVELLLKYQILHKQNEGILDFCQQIHESFLKVTNYKEFLIDSYRLLANSIQQKLNLTDQLSVENKQKMLKYAYKNYIQEGFCFHSFPSSILTKIKNDGILPERKYPLYQQMLEVEKIFNKHHKKKIFGINLKDDIDYFEITDSPSSAFFYALETPFYFSNLVNSFADELKYKDAYLRKDKVFCSNNVELLCNYKNLTLTEKETVMDYFNKQWTLIDGSNLNPVIALIERKTVGRDILDDYQQIIDDCDQRDIIYSLSKIMDSRYPNDRRYTKILPSELNFIEFPSYEKILTYKEKIEKQNEELSKITSEELANNHGHADVIALVGTLLITLGCTLFIVKMYFKI